MPNFLLIIELFVVFFKIGLFTFGGGYAMIPLISQEALSRNWLDEIQFYNFIGISESTPGPFAINIATFIGFHKVGILGSISATLGVVMPSFLIILLIAKVSERMLKNHAFQTVLISFKPLIMAFILSTALTVFLRVYIVNDIIMKTDYKALIIFLTIGIISGLKIKKKSISPIILILISGILGVILYAFL